MKCLAFSFLSAPLSPTSLGGLLALGQQVAALNAISARVCQQNLVNKQNAGMTCREAGTLNYY